MCCHVADARPCGCVPDLSRPVLSVSCPSGDDPHTDNQASEVQYLACTHTSGTFTLSFRGQTTGSIAFNHVLGAGGTGDLEKELEALSRSVCHGTFRDCALPSCVHASTTTASFYACCSIRNVTLEAVNSTSTHICDHAGPFVCRRISFFLFWRRGDVDARRVLNVVAMHRSPLQSQPSPLSRRLEMFRFWW